MKPNTTYYYRAYAGSNLGEVKSFTTPPAAIVVNDITIITFEATDITNTSAIAGGWLEWPDNNNGTIEYGLYWGTTNNPTTKLVGGATIAFYGSFSRVLIGLTPNTTYYFRIYAGSSLGPVMSFTTLPN